MAAWTLPNRIADWCEILTTALDRRSRKYFPTIILGMLLGSGRRTVSCWLRAAGVSDDWQDHYYFLQTLGRSAKRVATELLHLAVKQIPVSQIGEFIKLALDDSPRRDTDPKSSVRAPITIPRLDHRVPNSCTATFGSRSAGW
jgi:hypothetical protein